MCFKPMFILCSGLKHRANGGFHAEAVLTQSHGCADIKAHRRRSLSQTHRIARSVCAYIIESVMFDRVSGKERMFADGWHSTESPSVDQCIPTFMSH